MQDDGESLESSDTPTTELTGEDSTPSNNVGDSFTQLKGIGGQVVDALPALAVGLVIFILFLVVGRILRWAVQKWQGGRDRPNAYALAVSRLVYGGIIVLGLLVAAVIVFPNFTPTKLLQFHGFGSVAIGFAFRDVLQNYLAGILILFTQPFRIGDEIKFGDFVGKVTDVQTRATFLRTYDGRRAVVPNAELFTNSVLVNTAFDKRRCEYDIGIGYSDSIDEAKAIILDVMRESPDAVDQPPPEVLTMELGGEAVYLRARWWIDPPMRRDALDSRDVILQKAKERLLAAGIDLPYPTQQVLFHDQTEDRDGDRRTQREGWPTRKDDPDDTRARTSGQLRLETVRKAED